MKRKIFRWMSLLLIMVMSMTALFGCNPPATDDGEPLEKSDFAEVTATSVVYNDAGKYSTDVALTGITAKDIEVQYSIFNEVEYDKAVKDNPNVSFEQFIDTKQADIDNVTASGNSTTVSFTDKDAGANKTNGYVILAKNKKKAAAVDVTFTGYNLVPDIKSVASTATSVKVTLENRNGKYKSGIGKTDITLGGAFQNMNIDSVSSSDKNLTMQLSGTPFYDKDAHIYFDGIIKVSERVIDNAVEPAEVKIPVTFDSLTFSAAELTCDANGAVTVPIYCDSIADSATIKKDAISFESGVEVVSIENGADKAVLSLKVAGATDKNSAADILNGKKVTIGGKEFVAEFPSATFYPVFDFIDKQGTDFVLTIYLYAESGTLSATLGKSNITLGEDFASANIVSLDRDSDTVAKLVIKMPAGDKAVEDFVVNGAITLAEGMLVNTWGEGAPERSYTREYSKENMGKLFLWYDDIETIKKIVGGFGNTTFGTISAIASGSAQAVSVIKTVLELTGVVESETAEIKRLITELTDKLTSSMSFQTKILKDLHRDVNELSVNNFVSQVNNLDQYTRYINQYIRYAEEDLKKDKGIAMPPKNAPKKDWDRYHEDTIKYLKEQIRNKNDRYKNFDIRYEKMIELYTDVNTNLKMGVSKYDKLASLVYNTNTIAYPHRVLFLSKINRTLTDTITNIWLYEGYRTSWGVDCAEENRLYNEATAYLKAKEAENVSPEAIKNTTIGTAKVPVFYLFGNKQSNSFNWARHDNIGSMVTLGDDALTEFAIRMGGNTLEQELASAGFDVAALKAKKHELNGNKHLRYDYNCDNTAKGIAFRFSKRDRGEFCMNFKYNYNYYYNVMNWDDKSPQWDVKVWERWTGWHAYTYAYKNAYIAMY